MTTYPTQMLDRSALTARYRAARAVGNNVKADAVLAVLSYLDRRARARITSTGRRYPAALADQFDALVRLCWWWTTPVWTPAEPERPVSSTGDPASQQDTPVSGRR